MAMAFSKLAPTICLVALSALTGCTDPLVGRAFALDIQDTDWSEPPNIGADIGGYVPRFAFQFIDSDDGSLSLIMAALDTADAQDMCNTTASFSAATGEGPTTIDPGTFPARIADMETGETLPASIRDLTFTANLADSNDESGTLSAIIDVREIVVLVKQLVEPNPVALCNAIGDQGGMCTPCPHDGEEFCVTLMASNIAARELSSADLTPVRDADRGDDCP